MTDRGRTASETHRGGMVDRLGTVFGKIGRRAGRYADAVKRRRDVRDTMLDSRPVVLMATNDLSRSGAPLLVLEMATLLIADGYVPVVVSPVPGPFAARLRGIGARVLIDPRVNASPSWLQQLADRACWTICNTVETFGVVMTVAERSPTLWYLHEVSLLEKRLAQPEIRRAIEAVSVLWAGSSLCADKLRDMRPDVTVVPYGVMPRGDPPTHAPDRPLRIGIFGSIEPRKGQDLAVEAMALLSVEEQGAIMLTLYGRILDPAFAQPVLARAGTLGIAYAGELDHDAYGAAIAGSDAVLVSSRDDTLPIVSIDALGLGRMLLLSPYVGTAAWLDPGADVLVAPSGDAAGLAALLQSALARMGDAPAIGAAARRAFDRHFSRDAFHTRLRAGYAILEHAAS